MKTKCYKKLCGVVFCALFGLLSTSSFAAVITLDATNSGWYRSTGDSGAVNDANYIVGLSKSFDNNLLKEYHNYFVFNLAAVSNTIVSAELKIYVNKPADITGNTNAAAADGGYQSTDATETYKLFDVTTGIAALTAGTGGVAAYNDLSGGVAFGSRDYTNADEGSAPAITLNAASLVKLNASNELFAFGGSISTLTGAGGQAGDREGVFLYSSGEFTRELIITTAAPIPAAVWLFGSGLLGLIGVARRKKA